MPFLSLAIWGNMYWPQRPSAAKLPPRCPNRAFSPAISAVFPSGAHITTRGSPTVTRTPASGAWSAKASLPLVGSSGSHEAKDGTGLAWLNGFVYALKGNSTREFWGYAPGTPGQWTELTSIGGTITVGEGGALGASDDLLYALKGNSTVECWMHSPGGWDLMGASEELTLDAGPQPGYALAVTPNPLRERTVVSYSLPGAASVLVCLYDVTGARVVTLVSGRASAGSHYVAFRANGLAHGVYLLKLESGGAGVTRKLIVE